MGERNAATDARLDALYAKIPAFKCIPGCHTCCDAVPCGTVPFSAEEWPRLPVKRARRGKGCPYVLPSGACEVYEYRPFICRFFGTFEGARCQYGQGPPMLLTREEATALLEEYRGIVGDDLGLIPCPGQERARAEAPVGA